jgi:hypothetical protein
MTLVLSWVRPSGAGDVMYVASDSQLAGGGRWSFGPKIVPLPRPDAVIAWEGDTQWAYPLALQASNAIASYEPHRSRRLSLTLTAHHIRRILEVALQQADADAHQNHPVSAASLLIAGHCVDKGFVRYRYRFGVDAQGVPRCTLWQDKLAYTRMGSARVPADRLVATEVPIPPGKSTPLRRFRVHNMEPLWVLRRLLDDAEPEVGGPIQLVRIDRHGEVTAIAIRRATGELTVLGRELAVYENVSVPVARVDEMSDPVDDVPIDWPMRYVPREALEAELSQDGAIPATPPSVDY